MSALRVRRPRRLRQRRRNLYIADILAWADAFHRKHGRWPRATLALVVIVGSLLQARPVRADGDAHEKVLPSTAWVVAADGKLLSCGTGCLVDREQRLLVTCLHVIKDQTKATVFFPIFRQRGSVVSEAKEYLDRRTGVQARVVATDSRRNLAFLRLDQVPSEATSVEFGDRAPNPAEIVYGIVNSGVETV